MNDVFIERMVKKKMEPLDMLIIVGVLAAILVAGVIGFVVGFLRSEEHTSELQSHAY